MKNFKPDYEDNLNKLIIRSRDYIKAINEVLPINENDQKLVDDIASKYLSKLKIKPFPKNIKSE